MASFFDSHSIANALDQVIVKAEKHLLSVSPCISFSSILFERLQHAHEQGMEIDIVLGVTHGSCLMILLLSKNSLFNSMQRKIN
jgi:hypothetical protein